MVKHHEVILSAPRDLAEGGAPAILQRSDEDFIAAVLAGLRDAGGRVALRASLAQPASVASQSNASVYHYSKVIVRKSLTTIEYIKIPQHSNQEEVQKYDLHKKPYTKWFIPVAVEFGEYKNQHID